jgi:hypothetical protein
LEDIPVEVGGTSSERKGVAISDSGYKDERNEKDSITYHGRLGTL